MVNRIATIKQKATERANYYSNIGFINLANEFTNIGNFLAEIENVIKENEELKARIQVLEEKLSTKITEAAAARDAEGYD